MLSMLSLLMFQISGFAQGHYYYYGQERMTLESVPEQLIVGAQEGFSVEDESRLQAIVDPLGGEMSEIPLFTRNCWLITVDKTQPESEIRQLIESISQLPGIRFCDSMYRLPGEDSPLGLIDRLMVQTKVPMSEQQLEEFVAPYAAVKSETYKYDPNTFILTLGDEASENALGLANRLFETGMFHYAEPDFLWFNGASSVPDDPLFYKQWGLLNDGSSAQWGGTPDADIDAEEAWDITTGCPSVRIAIIDDGVDMSHPDLAPNVVAGFDATIHNSGGHPWNNDSHGTLCAGVAAAVGDNGIGVAGVAYSCKLVAVRIAVGIRITKDGFSKIVWTTTPSQAAYGINWAWYEGKADVLSNSWGGQAPSTGMDNAIHNAVTSGRDGLGSLVLFAAGNDGDGIVEYPASHPDAIAVGAMSMCEERKSLSSCDGESNWFSKYGDDLDVVAPGVKIPTTDIAGTAGEVSGDYKLDFRGTSAACPNAAGVAALILSANTLLTGQAAREILESTAQKVGSIPYDPSPGRPHGDWNEHMGYGLVNAHEAVWAATVRYIQDQTFTGVSEQSASSTLMAGENVTTTQSPGPVTVQPGADVDFYAGFKVDLKPGFRAIKGTSFHAYIEVPDCPREESVVRDHRNESGSGREKWEETLASGADPERVLVYPNPFSQELTLEFSAVQSDDVNFTILDMYGRQLLHIVNLSHSDGNNQVRVNTSDWSAGTYMYLFQIGNKIESGKIIRMGQ